MLGLEMIMHVENGSDDILEIKNNALWIQMSIKFEQAQTKFDEPNSSLLGNYNREVSLEDCGQYYKHYIITKILDWTLV